MKKVSNIKERIKELAVKTGVSQGDFFKKIGSTPANFRGKKLETGVNAELIEKIVSLYPTVDLYWLITGKTKSDVLEVNEPNPTYKKAKTSADTKCVVCEIKDEYIASLKENNKALINQLEGDSSKAS